MVMTLQQDTEQHYKKKLDAALAEQRQQLEEETKRAVVEAKKKQWCANCLEEAGFYCCFNTSYCSLNCQQNHWPSHIHSCQNSNKLEARNGSGSTQRSNSEPPAGSDRDICIVSVCGAMPKATLESSDTGLFNEQSTGQIPVIAEDRGANSVVYLEKEQCSSRAESAN
jgi:hypothetical protein